MRTTKITVDTEVLLFESDDIFTISEIYKEREDSTQVFISGEFRNGEERQWVPFTDIYAIVTEIPIGDINRQSARLISEVCWKEN